MICHRDAQPGEPAHPTAERGPRGPQAKPKRLPSLLRSAWFSLNQAFRRRILHTGVTPDQYTVLRTLVEHEPELLSQAELTRLITSDPNTVASLLERMEGAGWIDRIPHERDRRARRIRVRNEGREKFASVRQYTLDLQGEVMAALPPGERETFLERLALIAGVCRVAAEDASRRMRQADGEVSEPLAK